MILEGRCSSGKEGIARIFLLLELRRLVKLVGWRVVPECTPEWHLTPGGSKGLFGPNSVTGIINQLKF